MDVFSVGVTITLVDRVSTALGAMSLGFARSEAAATALQARMLAIRNTFTAGLLLVGGGMALAAPLVAATHAAVDYEHQLNRMTSAGLSHKEMTDSIAAAWQTTGKIITSTATENLKVIMDLRSVFGKTDEGIQYMPKFAQIQGAIAGVSDLKSAKGADNIAFSMAKALDMVGKVRNQAEFNSGVGQMFRAIEATGGRVMPADYMNVFKYARQAKFGLSDDFTYRLLPELILENKGGSGSSGGVGPQIAALYRFGVQGIMKKQAAEQLRDMGMINGVRMLKTTTTGTTVSGGVLGAGMLAQNPAKWVNEILVPHLMSHFHIAKGETDKLIQASNQVFKGNQLATSLVGELIKKQVQYQRFPGLYDKTDTIETAYTRGMKNDPAMNFKALGASLHNLETVFGIHVIPIIVPMINNFAQAIANFAVQMEKHPRIASTGVNLLSAAAGTMVTVGLVKGVQAGLASLQLMAGAVGVFKLAGTAFSALSTPFLRLILTAATVQGPLFMTAAALMRLTVTGAAVTLAIGAAVAVFKNWGNIVGFMKEHAIIAVHAFVQLEKGMDAVGKTAMAMASWLVAAAGKIGSIVGAIPGLSAIGAAMGAAATFAGKAAQGAVGAAQADASKYAKQDAAYLEKKGQHALADIARSSAKGGQQIAYHTTNNINVHGAPGQSPKQIADAVMDQLSKKARHAASAITSAGGVPQSKHSFGAVR
jgi:hypothetical protein